jgi:FAD/FMN-containing dehydrogenase/ferredoxin
MNQNQQTTLQNIVSRVTFDRVERKLYGHDIAAMPSLVKPLIGETIPEAVVQPKNEAEVIAIARWATKNHVPLTPRGKATSGYGGAVPIKKGVVVDFYFMKAILAVDPTGMTVTVQSGITWEQLDKHIASHKLTLRLYPSSYPSSTVGGWLAQGGAGFGSYEYGYFRDNVVSARVVLPSGEVRTFSGSELDLVSEAEGITGFITEVTLRDQSLEPMAVLALSAPDAQHFQKLIEDILAANLPIWSMLFINPKMAELKNKAPRQRHLDHEVGTHIELPKAYILTLTYRTKDEDTIQEALPQLMLSARASVLSEAIAAHEWENRFKLMMVKRLGPSLVPSEVVIPLSHLAEVMDEVGKKVVQPLVKEGVVIRNGVNGQPEVVILGFIPADERKLAYNFVFALSLTVIGIAEAHGGRAYSTGLYFSKKVNQVLGADRVERLRSFKEQVDPTHLMNPGKVISSGILGTFLQVAGTFEPVARTFGNSVKVSIGERPSLKPVRDIPADVAWYALACSQCGYCVDECDQFYGRGWESQSPRGKWYWLREYMAGREQWTQAMVDTFMVCTTCELCNDRCSAALPIEPSWMKLRGILIQDEKRLTIPPFEMMKAATHSQGDIWAGYRKDRGAWFPADMQASHGPDHKSKNVYFAGCTTSYVEHDM